MQPVIFDEFFELGLPETSSPFLTPTSRKFGKGLKMRASILAAILLLAAFVTSFFPSTEFISPIFLVFVFFLAGTQNLIESVQDLLIFDVNIDVLMTLAAFGSIFIGGAMEGGLLLVLFSISESLEEAVSMKAKGALRHLRKLSPKKGLVIKADGSTVERAVQDIPVGSKILVRSGEMVPLDGVVLEGASFVNLVHLTGESQGVSKEKGDSVPAGAFTIEGLLTLQVTATSYDSTLSKIIHLVTEAQEAKPNLQRWFDSASYAYSMTIILLCLFFALTLPTFLGIPFLGPEGSIYRALAFLIAASPCALILAIPIAYLSAISSLAKKGILLKGGITLDALLQTKLIAFDKTGTLTTGDLTLVGIESLNHSTVDPLAYAYSLERGATHPIARAIVAEANRKNISPLTVQNFQTIPGQGLSALIGQKSIFIGNPAPFKALKEKVDNYREKGEIVAVLNVDDESFLFRFTDQIRPNLKPLMDTLKNVYNYTLYLLTGDHEGNGRLVSSVVGIDHTFSNLTPEDKLSHVSALSNDHGLIMVGDGINDAPALARASVGIAMGKVGSGAALDASDIVLLQDNLDLLPSLIEKARLTKTIVNQNLTIAITAIIFASVLSVAGFIPLWLAVVFHEGGTVLVGLNALRLLK